MRRRPLCCVAACIVLVLLALVAGCTEEEQKRAQQAIDQAASDIADQAKKAAEDEARRQADRLAQELRERLGQNTPGQAAPPAGAPPANRDANQQVVLKVPFQSQWEGKTGAGNCGPASITMAIRYYGKTIDYKDAIARIRGSDHPTGDTNFRWPSYINLLANHGLIERDARSIGAVRNEVDQGHPVVIGIDNTFIRRTENGRSVPYPNENGYLGDHIVVIAGYELDTAGNVQAVYMNDPLAIKLLDGAYVADPDTGTDFRVPMDALDRAAQAQRWNAVAIVPE